MRFAKEWITFCYTTDLAATARFYEDIVELPLALDQGGCRIYRVREGAYLGFCDRGPRPTDGVILTFVTDDVDGWYEQLRSRNVDVLAAPRVHPEYGIYHFFFRDPNGYLLEVQRFDRPDWDVSRDETEARHAT